MNIIRLQFQTFPLVIKARYYGDVLNMSVHALLLVRLSATVVWFIHWTIK